MLDSDGASPRVGLLWLHCLIDDVALVSCQDDWLLFADELLQLREPRLGLIEGVHVGDIIDKQSARSSLVVVLGQSMVLLLTSSVPDDQFDLLLTNTDLLVKEARINRTVLLLVELVPHEPQGQRGLSHSCYR